MNKKVTYGQLRRKLFSATAMLLVASIMMVSSSFAWYVLSTAPEVSNIKTQVGANGALEIALLDSQSWNDLNRLDMGDIDESKTTTAAEDNLTWGNLVDLGSASYGLDKIVLNPARLYLEESGVNGGGYSVGNTLLKTPVYGEDGRVKGLDKTSAVAYICEKGQFSKDGHGVRAIGTCASMSVGQLGLNAARTNIISSATAARAAASNTLNSTGGDLANIVVAYAVNNKTSGYTKEDVQSIKDLATGLQPSLEHIETALRYVFAGYICTEGSSVSAEDYTTALEEIQSSETSLSALLTRYPGISNMIQNMSVYITELTTDQKTVQDAINNCDEKINGDKTDFTWTEISAIVQPLANTANMTVGGKNIDQLKKDLKNEDGSINFDAAFKLVQGGVTITVPTGSGLLSDIADFAGDYVATVTVKDVQVGNLGTLDANATMKTAGETPTYLTNCSTGLAGATVGGGATSASITDYYGYALDLAFRTNAADSSLLLQTDPENRIYESDGQNAALQGGGSYMTFKTEAGLSATKMVKLMSGIRVVFMDGERNVLGIAVLDCTLGKDNYTLLTEEQKKTAPGKYAYLNNGTNTYQVSDLIDETTYNALPANSSVVFERAAAVSGDETETAGALTGYITAKLYLHNFQLKKNSENNQSTGQLLIGEKKDSAAITALEQDVAQKVTALVYLDGSVVTNASVAANAAQSMSGTLNLQFASSAELVPAENTKLRSGGSAPESGNTDNTGTETGGSETGNSETNGG